MSSSRFSARSFIPASSSARRYNMKSMRNLIVGLTLLASCCFYCATGQQRQRDALFFRLYTGGTVDEYVDAYLEEAVSLIDNIDSDKPTVLYIHGFTESVNSHSVNTVIAAYLNRTDHNVLALDWSLLSVANYVRVTSNAEPVGIAVASALNEMVRAGLSPTKLHLVGHSMGAHVSGFVGRNVDFPLPRITGLDPAGPLFNVIGKHLASSDAQFVDVIHTDWGFYGIAKVSASVDFFPNGGRRVQPGCPTRYRLYSKEDFCSHHRSWLYYSESLNSERAFIGRRCTENDNDRSLARKRDVSDTIVMGHDTPTDAKGSYCLFTGASAPYGRGAEGAHEA